MMLKNIEIVELAAIINGSIRNSSRSNIVDTRFSFWGNLIINKTSDIIKSIREASKTKVEGYEKYNGLKDQIIYKYCTKDDYGEPKIGPNNLPVISKSNFDDFERELSELNRANINIINEYNKEQRLIESTLMNESVEIDLPKISFSILPKWLNMDQFNILKKLIKETDEEILEIISR